MGFPEELKQQLLAPFTKKPAEPAAQTAAPAQQGFPQDLAQSLLAPFQSKSAAPPPSAATPSGGGSGGFSGGAPENAGPVDHSSREAFVRSMIPYAKQAEAATGIPAEIMMAINLNEQGWQTPAPGNNYFGIKGSNPRTGANTGAVSTWEDYGNGPVQIKDTFRAYDSPAESYADFGNFLKENSRYKPALEILQRTGDPAAFIKAVHAAGYATDPEWSNKIISIARSIGGSASQPMLADNAPESAPSASPRNTIKGMSYEQIQADPELQSGVQNYNVTPEDYTSSNPPTRDDWRLNDQNNNALPVDESQSSEPASSQPEAPLNPMQQFANTLASAAQALKDSFDAPDQGVEPQRPARPENFNLAAAEDAATKADSVLGISEKVAPYAQAARDTFEGVGGTYPDETHPFMKTVLGATRGQTSERDAEEEQRLADSGPVGSALVNTNRALRDARGNIFAAASVIPNVVDTALPDAAKRENFHDPLLGLGIADVVPQPNALGAGFGRAGSQAPNLLERAGGKIAQAVKGLKIPSPSSNIVDDAATDRYYHGTGGDFARPDPGKFDPNGLFGPGYYITDAPEVAASGDVLRPGYGEQRGNVLKSEDPWIKANYEDAVTELDRIKRQWAIWGKRPESETAQQIKSQMDAQAATVEQLRAKLDEPFQSGPNIRPIDVPRDLNLLDADAPKAADLEVIAEALNKRFGDGEGQNFLTNMRIQGATAMDGETLFNVLKGYVRDIPNAGVSWEDAPAEVNRLLSSAGFDGIKYAGGKRIPMTAADGSAIEHNAIAIFPESLDKIRNATAGTPGGFSAATGNPSNLAIGKKISKDAVQGGVAGAVAQNQENPESTPQDYLAAAMKGAAGGVLRGHLRDRYMPSQGSAVVSRAAADASKDFDTIKAEREQVARGVPRPSNYASDVDDFFSLKGRLKRYAENPTAMSDRRELMNALEQHRAAKGEPMSFAEKIYTRLRLYDGQGNADAALQRLDTNVRPAFEAFAKDGGDELDLSTLFEQLDNVYKDAASARSFGVPPPAPGTNASPMRPARQFSGGATVQAEQDIWDHIEQRFGPKRAKLMRDAADAASAHMDELRQELLDAGVISQEARDFWRDNFHHYFPAKILAYEADDKAIEQMGSRGALLGTREDGYRRLTEAGTEKMREDPIVSMIDATVAVHKLAERNKMMRDFATFADTPYSSQFVEHLKDTSKLKDGYTSIAYRDGDTVKHVQVVDPLVPALTLTQSGQNVALRVIAVPGNIFKQGVTSLRPSFMAVNGLYDAFSTTMRQMIEAPNPIEAARAFTDLARGYRAAIGGTATGRSLSATAGAVAGNQTTDPDEPILSTDRAVRIAAGAAAGFAAGKGIQKKWGAEDRALIERYRRSGASIYTGTRWDDRPDMIAKELMGKHVWVRTIRSEADLKTAMKDTWGATRDVIGLAWSRPLEAVGAPIEMAPRLGEFARAERQGVSQAEAALRSRRISTDFPGGGSTMKVVNMLVPFMNPAVQGSLEFAQLVRKHPAQSIAGFGVVAAAAFAAMAHNRAISEEDYADVSRTIGNTGIFLLDPNDPPEGQKRGVYYLPMRGGMAAVVPLIKKFYDDAYASGAALDWAGVARQMGSTLTPFPGDATGATGALLPPSLKTVAELASNYNIYTGQAIVPKSLEGLPPSEQYNERTTAAARALGAVTNKPPIAWDYGLGNVSKGPYEAATGVADIAFDVTGKTPDSRYADRGKEKTAADQPITGSIAGRVIRSVGNERQNRLYEQADAMIARNEANTVQAVKDSVEYQSATPDRQAQMMRQAQSVLAEQARAILDLEPKAKDLGQPSRWSGVTPGSDRERSIISAIGTPSDKRTPRQQALADQYRGRETEAYRRWSERKQITDEKLKSAVKSSVEP